MTLEDVHLARRELKDSCSSVVCYLVSTLSLPLIGLALLSQSWTEWSLGHKNQAMAVFCLGVCFLSLFLLALFLGYRVYRGHRAVGDKHDEVVARDEAEDQSNRVP
jgi:hypothetical protein